jgi:hypothetical protein
MSNENDTSRESWEEPAEESDEVETHLRQRPQRASRDASDIPSTPQKQRTQHTGGSREAGKDTPGSYEKRPVRRSSSNRNADPRQGYDAYGRPRYGTRSYRDDYEYTTEPRRERPRQTRDFHERSDPYDELDESYHQQHRMSRRSREEAEARLRMRRRQPENYYEEANDAYMHPRQHSRSYVDSEVQEYNGRAYRQRPRTQIPQAPKKRQRRVWSTLLIGCAGGVITIALILAAVAFLFLRNAPIHIGGVGGIGKSSYSKQIAQQALPITANVTQLQVHNRVGNISIMVDPSATQGSLTGVMKVQAGSSSDADKEFGRIKVNVSTSSDHSTVVVNAAVPDASSGLLASSSDSVDLTLVLPQTVNASPPFKLSLSANVIASGNITVQNFNGLLSLTNNTGNIAVSGGLQSEGSCLQTNVGNVTFAANLVTGQAADTGLIPCTTNTTQNTHPWFSFKSGTGSVSVTLSAVTSNLTLDASTNNGKINGNEFSLKVQQNSDGSASYYGPLTPGTSPTAVLKLAVSTGDITLHKAG